jgi:hypothetical protein
LAFQRHFLSPGMGVEILSSYRKEGPAVLARAPRCAQSLAGFPQRIFIGFIKTLDCAAVEALIPNLQPRAERFGRAQFLYGVTERLTRTTLVGSIMPLVTRFTYSPFWASKPKLY